MQRVFPSGDELLTRKKNPYVGFFNEIYLLRLASELWSFISCFCEYSLLTSDNSNYFS